MWSDEMKDLDERLRRAASGLLDLSLETSDPDERARLSAKRSGIEVVIDMIRAYQ